jgi:hypothetical protein
MAGLSFAFLGVLEDGPGDKIYRIASGGQVVIKADSRPGRPSRKMARNGFRCRAAD